jgi:hypothetical protein
VIADSSPCPVHSLCKLKDHWGALCEYKQPEMTYLLLAVETITKQCDALIAKWFNQQGERAARV